MILVLKSVFTLFLAVVLALFAVIHAFFRKIYITGKLKCLVWYTVLI